MALGTLFEHHVALVGDYDDLLASLDPISRLHVQVHDAHGNPPEQKRLLEEVEDLLAHTDKAEEQRHLEIIHRRLLWDLDDERYISAIANEIERNVEPERSGAFIEIASNLRTRPDANYWRYLRLVELHSPDAIVVCELVEAIARYTPLREVIQAYPSVTNLLRTFASSVGVGIGTEEELLELFRNYMHDRRLVAKLRHYDQPIASGQLKTEYWQRRIAEQESNEK